MTEPTTVRVRFAPSPTGYLHVGGARTAIFNWLYARRHGGTFVLRIEDTDEQRSSAEMVQAILDGLAWLGVEPDEGPEFQSAARERHVRDARTLLGAGHAYRCFCDPDALRGARESAAGGGGDWIYPRSCRAIPRAESDRRAAAGERFAIRFAVPDGETAWDDLVHGATRVGHAVLEDFVILRSGGTPTYMLSVVSDDVAMRITHVIRGDDHLSNTPKQILLYGALGRPIPTFAHLPLILGEDKKRLSKRHGAVSVLEYRDRGYLPEAMFNFLALLGWSPGGDREKLGRDELVRAFDLAQVGRSGAVFDLRKLDWLNGEYLREMPVAALAATLQPRLAAAGLWRDAFDAEERSALATALDLLRARAKTLDDFVAQGRPYLEASDEIDYDPEAERKHIGTPGVGAHLVALASRLRDVADWTPPALEPALREVAAARGVSAGALIHPLRLALTGQAVSPGIFDVLAALGRERSLGRIARLVRRLDSGGGAMGKPSGGC